MSSSKKIGIFHGIGRRLLVWFSIFFLIPLLTVSYTSYQQSKKAIQYQVFEHFESLLNLQKDALSNYLRQKEDQLRTTVKENEFLFISTVVLQSTTFSRESILNARKRLQKYLRDKNEEFGSRALWITGTQGIVIASSDEERMGTDRKNAPDFVVSRQHLASVSSLYLETGGQPTVLIATPIQSENNEFLGLFTLSINMEDISRLLESPKGLDKTGETFLVNKEGYFISRSRFLNDVILKRKVDLPEMYKGENWIRSQDYVRNYRGAQVIRNYIPFPRFGWTLIAEMETSEAFRKLVVQFHQTILIGLCLFALLVVSAIIISRNLTRPIRALVLAAQRVGGGNLDLRITTKSHDELAELAHEFNRMTENLKASKKKMEDWNASIQEEVELRTQELIKSEMKFHNLIEKANDAILIFNADDQRCILANLKAENLTGRNQGELRESRFTDFFLPEDLDRIRVHYQEALSEGFSNLYRIPLKRKDGRYAFVDISNSLIEFQEQRFINCILHDMTEQRKVDRHREAIFEISDILAKNSNLKLILNKALENILYNLELELAVVYLYNPKTEELELVSQRGFSEDFRIDFGRIPLKSTTELICAKTVNTRQIQIADHPFRGGMSRYINGETDAENLQSIFSLPLIAEGKLAGVLQLISNRHRGFSGDDLILLEALSNQLAAGILRIQLEEGKHKDDQFLASILTDSVDGIISMDAEDRITTWNNGAEKIFHLKKEEVLGIPFQSLFKQPERIRQDDMHKDLHANGFVKDFEITNVTQNGQEIALHIALTAIRDPNNEFIGSSAVIRDITEQKRIQERLQQSDKLSSIGQLAAGIAHEIGTPLNIISGNAEYLMMDMDENNPLMEELSIIVHQTERITQLIQQLMDFAHDTQPRFEETDVNALIRKTLNLTKHQMNKRSIRVTLHLSDEIPSVIADPYQLQQVFLNMILNAMQAMPTGGTLQIRTKFDEIQQELQIKIRDTGCGIRPEDLKNIFNPFFTTKEVGQGTGLGLSVCHRIMESHKGNIKVESRLNKGTLFTLTLPVQTSGVTRP